MLFRSFIPLLFMSGLVGRMFREFALTLTIAVVTSAIVSLTLTPMMCSRLLKHTGEEMAVPGLAAVSRFIDGMVAFYHRTLLVVLQHRTMTMMVTIATIALTLVMYLMAPKGFLPLQELFRTKGRIFPSAEDLYRFSAQASALTPERIHPLALADKRLD